MNRSARAAAEGLVVFSCDEHTDKARKGIWLINETPAKCDFCGKQSEWCFISKEPQHEENQ